MERSLLEDVDQAEGQQHLVEVVALVEVPKQQPFQQQPEQRRTARAPPTMASVKLPVRLAERPGQVGAEHVEAAVREVDHAHDAEDQREPGGQHEQQQAVLHAVEQLDQEIGEIHGLSQAAGG